MLEKNMFFNSLTVNSSAPKCANYSIGEIQTLHLSLRYQASVPLSY